MRMKAAGFLLVTNDAYGINSPRIPAIDVIQYRLQAGYWPIYSGTPCRTSFFSEAFVAFYAGGQKKNAQCIVAHGLIADANARTQRSIQYDPSDVLSPPASFLLHLKDIKYLETPIPLRPFVGKTPLLPKHIRRWGIYLTGGCRKLTAVDINNIFST